MKNFFAKWVVLIGLLAGVAAPELSRAASRQEARDYAFGTNLFADGNYQQAELEFNKFVNTYTNSTQLTNALLYLARARLGMSNYTEALDVLQNKLPANDTRVLHYLALAYFGAGDFTNAAASCGLLLQRLPEEDASRLGMARLQAQALAKLEDWQGVIDLLSKSDGVFQKAARQQAGSDEAVNGFFLLGEAFLKEKRYGEAESALREADTASLSQEMKWKRDYLLCRILMEAGRTEEALTNSVELASLQAGEKEGIDTAYLRGEILERLNRATEALNEYSKNLAQGLPTDVNRQAMIKTIELAQGKEANDRMEQFIEQRPKDTNLDMALWYVGDFSLKEYFGAQEAGTNTPAPGDTNLLQMAVANLERLTNDFPKSDLLGKAFLDLGWTDWAQGRFGGAKTNFLRAFDDLPFSEDRAVALLKLADAQFKEGDYQDAAGHYGKLLTDYDSMANVTNELFDRALYQLAQADIRTGDEKGAEAAAGRLANAYRDSAFGERSYLLLGEDFTQKAEFARAREMFTNLLASYTNSALKPDIEFAVARTFEQEGDWSNAVIACSNWLGNTNYAGNALLPQVAFACALDTGKAGQESNAFAMMTNFVALYQSNNPAGETLAPLAQNWIGDYYRNHGENAPADYAYQKLWLMFPGATNLVFQARLMAGRAAQAYDWPQASNDFLYLTENTNTPAAILGEAWFQLGYTDFRQFQDNPTNKAMLSDALAALSHVTNASPSNAIAPQALGQMGNCWLAFGALEALPADKTNDLETAAQLFQAELDLPESDVTARSQAEYGLGMVAQRMGRKDEAVNHYLSVVYNRVIDDASPEKPDPVWVKEAGVAAWQLCVEMNDWKDATNILARMKEAVPTLGAEMDRLSLKAPGGGGGGADK